LWCRGPPGAGKTVLASVAIDHFINDSLPGVGIAWFYCDYANEDSMKSVEQTLSCIIRQLVQRREFLPFEIISLYAAHQESGFCRAPPTFDELSELLVSTARSFDTVYVVIDALDEYPQHLRDRLLLALHHAKCQLLITSREHIQLEATFHNYSTIDVSATPNDLILFVRDELETFNLARQIRANPELQEKIIKAVTDKTNGL
jgi:Cdc6-like AAA superfamily ATPase